MKSNPAPSPAVTGSELPVTAPPRDRGARRGFWIAVAVAACWLLVLGSLALFTANPITLNVEQVRASEYVVTGRVAGEERSVLVVESQWKGAETPAELRVGNLSQTAIRPGRSYLVPLSRTRSGALEVTETDLPENPPLVYPATEEAIAQLAAILSDDSAAQSSSGSASAPDR